MYSRTVTVTATPTSLYDLLADGGVSKHGDEVVLQADVGNSGRVFYGDQAVQPMSLLADATVLLPISGITSLFIVGTASDQLHVFIP